MSFPDYCGMPHVICQIPLKIKFLTYKSNCYINGNLKKIPIVECQKVFIMTTIAVLKTYL